jgi:hypothetical protein
VTTSEFVIIIQGRRTYDLPSAVGNSRADFTSPEKTEIKAPRETPIFHFGSGFPSYSESTIAIMTIQIKLKLQLVISVIHQSVNHRRNQFREDVRGFVVVGKSAKCLRSADGNETLLEGILLSPEMLGSPCFVVARVHIDCEDCDEALVHGRSGGEPWVWFGSS